MSRLQSAIRRLQAQAACLDAAAAMIAGLPGPVLEVGLGNGRTYDHLRRLLPDREIFVFDRQVNAHPDCVPDEAHLILGDLRETLDRAADRIGARAALVHADIGSGDAAATAALTALVWPKLCRLMAPGAIAVSDQPVPGDILQPLPLPDSVAPGRYHLYRAP